MATFTNRVFDPDTPGAGAGASFVRWDTPAPDDIGTFYPDPFGSGFGATSDFTIESKMSGGTDDHGVLFGLGDDDHPQYLLIDGTRAMTGDLDMATFDILNVGAMDFDSASFTSADPFLIFNESDADPDEKVWRMKADTGAFVFETLTDALGAGVAIFTVDRTGTAIDSMTLDIPVHMASGGGILMSAGASLVGATNVTQGQAVISTGLGTGILFLQDTAALADEGNYLMSSVGGLFRLETANDVLGVFEDVFSANRTGTVVDEVLFSTPLLTLASGAPVFRMSDQPGAFNEKIWQVIIDTGDLSIQALDDTATVDETAIIISRTGTVVNRVAFGVNAELSVFINQTDNTDVSLGIINAGTDGADVDVFVGDIDPISVVTGAPGDLYFRANDGVDSDLLLHTGAAANATDWESLRTTREVFWQVVSPDSTTGIFNAHVIASNGNATIAEFFVPHDFHSIVEAVVVGVPGGSDAAADIDLTANYGTAGEATNANVETDAAITFNLTTSVFNECDVSSVLTGIAPGDYVAIDIDHNTIGFAVDYIGIRFRYV